jgi:VanZ family protein
LLTIYAAALTTWRLFPFQFTVRPGAIWQKIEAGRIGVIPFRTLAGSPDAIVKLAELTLAGIPLGALAMSAGARRGQRRAVPVAALLATAFVAVVEGLVVFTTSGAADTGHILAGAGGALVGAVVAGQLSHRDVQRPALSRGATSLWAGVVGWVGVMTAYEWSPFTFRFTKEAIKDGLERLTLLPFGFYARDAPPIAFLNITRKTLLGVPLGLLLALALGRQWPSIPRLLRVAFTFFAVVVFLTILEAGQILLPERVPESTDVILPAVAATVAAWLVTPQR